MHSREVSSYFNKKMGLNRNIFARVIDLAAITCVILVGVFVFIYISFNMLGSSIIIAVAISSIFLALFIKIRNKKRNTFIKKEIELLTSECAIEKLVLMADEQFKSLVKLHLKEKGLTYIKPNKSGFTAKLAGAPYFVACFQNHYTNDLTCKEILSSIKAKDKYKIQHLIIVSTSKLSEEAEKLVDKVSGHDSDGNLSIILSEELLSTGKSEKYLPTPEQVDEFILSEIRSDKKTLDELKKEVLNAKKARTYIVIGVTILVWSYFTGFKIYYPIITLLCFALAFLSFRRRKKSDV